MTVTPWWYMLLVTLHYTWRDRAPYANRPVRVWPFVNRKYLQESCELNQQACCSAIPGGISATRWKTKFDGHLRSRSDERLVLGLTAPFAIGRGVTVNICCSEYKQEEREEMTCVMFMILPSYNRIRSIRKLTLMALVDFGIALPLAKSSATLV